MLIPVGSEGATDRAVLAGCGDEHAVLVQACAAGAGARTTGTGVGVVSEESVGWRDRPALNGTDLVDFLVLRLVCAALESGVAQVGEHFVENQRPVLPFLADGLIALIEVGHLTVGNSASCGIRPVLVTATGRARYEELCDRQGLSPYPVVVDGRHSDDRGPQ